MRRLSYVFFLAGALACIAVAQSESSDQMNARDIFWESADLAGKQPKPVTAKTVKKTTAQTTAAVSTQTTAATHTAKVSGQLGLRYTILKALPGGGQVGVLPDTAFKAHDKIRLSVESNKTGYLYVIQQGSTGTWTSLYPEQGQQHQIKPGNEYIIPSETDGFEFDEHAGQERVFILLSETPVEDLESLIKQAQGDGNQRVATSSDHAITDVINTIQMGSRDLVFAKASKDAPAAGAKEQDSAMYVVNKNPDSSRLVVNMVLKHQ
jgi:hypothetical protein